MGFRTSVLQDLLKFCFPSQTSYSLRNHVGLSFVILELQQHHILKAFYYQLFTFGMTHHCIPVLRSAKRAPANVRRLNNRKCRQRYCSVGERSRALALLNAALMSPNIVFFLKWYKTSFI